MNTTLEQARLCNDSKTSKCKRSIANKINSDQEELFVEIVDSELMYSSASNINSRRDMPDATKFNPKQAWLREGKLDPNSTKLDASKKAPEQFSPKAGDLGPMMPRLRANIIEPSAT